MQTVINIALPTILYLLWQYQAMNEGKNQGLYYSCKNKNKLLSGLDEHKFWTMQRCVIAFGFVSQFLTGKIYYANGIGSTIWKTIALSIAYILVFSFWHNGKMYVTYNKYTLSTRYAKGWKASPDGKAKNDFTYPQRRNMLVGGWAIFIILILTEIV